MPHSPRKHLNYLLGQANTRSGHAARLEEKIEGGKVFYRVHLHTRRGGRHAILTGWMRAREMKAWATGFEVGIRIAKPPKKEPRRYIGPPRTYQKKIPPKATQTLQ